MPKYPSSAGGSPRLNSPGLGASPHVGRRPSPLSRSASQTATILECKGAIGSSNDTNKLTVVASVAPSQPPSTDEATPNHPADLGHQSSASKMHIADSGSLPSQIPFVSQDSHRPSVLPTSMGHSSQAVSQAPQAHTGPLGRLYGSGMDAMDTDTSPSQNNQNPFILQGYGKNTLPIADGYFNQTESQASQTYTGSSTPDSVQTGFQAPHSYDQQQSWSQNQG